MKLHTLQLTGFVFALLLSLVLWVRPITAANTPNLYPIAIHEDKFYNYDFDSRGPVATNNVDWPVTMIFYGNAWNAKVLCVYWCGALNGLYKYEYLEDQPSVGYWSSSAGTKSTLNWCTEWVLHMRLYANANHRSYNESWGFYVLGTTHYSGFQRR